MKERLKSFLYLWQRAMFYFGTAKNETTKPLVFLNETLLLLTFFSVKGINFGALETLIAYAVVMAIMIIAGIVLVNLGVVQYMQRLGNQQSPELMEILSTVKRIEERLK